MEYFITRYDTNVPAGALCAVLEDSIMHKGYPATAGSKILESFVSPLDATVVTRLNEAGICIIGKTKMSEFGIDIAEFKDMGDAANPEFNSGAVAAVADGIADFALCNDYTGAIGGEAAMRGLFCIRPTYGTVSRYGLIPSVPSMDQIGVVCKNPADGFRILSTISGYDEKDGALLEIGRDHNAENRPLTCALFNTENRLLAYETENRPLAYIEVELKYMGVIAQVMQILCTAELSNNISRYDGIKFGYRAEGYKDLHELYTKSRTEAFGPNAKLSAIIGAMVLSQENYTRYYDKAMRIRRLIKESLDFNKYDIIIVPAGIAKHGDDPSVMQNQVHESCSCLAALCGLPAVTLPRDKGGVTLIADAGREDVLESILCLHP